MPKITMTEVARAAGVTQATVSMALRGDARISAVTRERVEAAARRLDYRPDPLVSALMAQRRRGRAGGRGLGTIGVVSLWPDARHSWRTQTFYAPYREGVSERADRLGYRLDFFDCDGSEREVRMVQRALKARGIEGVLFPQADASVTSLPFDVSSWAAVYIGNGIRTPHLSRVDAALDFDFRLAWRRVRAAGFRRIGFVTMKSTTLKNDGAWVGAHLHAQRELPEADRLPPCEVELEGNEEPLWSWLRRWKPDAVLSDNNGLLETLRDGEARARLYSLAVQGGGEFAGVHVGRKQIGAAAVDLVVGQLARGERGVPEIAKRVMIEGWWSEGAGARDERG